MRHEVEPGDFPGVVYIDLLKNFLKALPGACAWRWVTAGRAEEWVRDRLTVLLMDGLRQAEVGRNLLVAPEAKDEGALVDGAAAMGVELVEDGPRNIPRAWSYVSLRVVRLGLELVLALIVGE